MLEMSPVSMNVLQTVVLAVDTITILLMLYVQVLDSICLISTDVSLIVHGSSYSNCTDGQVRLFGGSTDYEGTVEVCLNHAWGTIAYYIYGYAAQVICNALGYKTPGLIIKWYRYI